MERDIKTVLVGKATQKMETAKRELAAFGKVEIIQANLYEPINVQRVVAFGENHSQHIQY